MDMVAIGIGVLTVGLAVGWCCGYVAGRQDMAALSEVVRRAIVGEQQ